MYRSQIIERAQKHIPQSSEDQMWDNLDWSDYFDEAVDILHTAFVRADTDCFIKRNYALTKNLSNLYPLPADFHALLYSEDSNQIEIQVAEHHDEKREKVSGLVLDGAYIRLVNWQESMPTTIYVDYVHEPKIIPEWDGLDDSMKVVPEQYEPDYPLNSKRAARVLSRIIAMLASLKDERITSESYQQMTILADNFVDKFLSRNKAE